ncbi:MAG: ribonuclease III [Chloroflexota bacterium]
MNRLQQVLGVTFHNAELLEQALVHGSFLNENPGFPLPSNERLEFLGDAVLSLVVGETLYQRFPELPEGSLTRMRSGLVCQETLHKVATELGVGEYLRLGQGEDMSGGRSKPSNLAAALEAVVGAIYLDQGLEAARDFTLRLLGDEVEAQSPDAPVDYKSQLQEFLHSQKRPAPTYRVVETSGPDHARTFTTEVLEGDTVHGHGSGHSKKSAEMAAARAALEKLQRGRGVGC